jgi:hypothetical protein
MFPFDPVRRAAPRRSPLLLRTADQKKGGGSAAARVRVVARYRNEVCSAEMLYARPARAAILSYFASLSNLGGPKLACSTKWRALLVKEKGLWLVPFAS